MNIPAFDGQPLLARVAEEVLRGESGVPELLDTMDATIRELEAERDRMRAWLAAEPAAVRDTCRAEVRAAEESLFDFLGWARACQGYAASFDAGQLSDIARALPVVAQRLQLDCLRLHRGLWSARGPGTHAGVNRLLHAGDDFEAALDQELHFLEAELQALPGSTPSALLEPQRELLEEAAEWMRAAPPDHEDDEWAAAGEEWSVAWARLDLGFLAGRFSEAPTRFPSLNLAINTAWLRCEERVDPRLVACCLEAAQQSLRDLPLHPPSEAQSEAQTAALADLESLRADLADALAALAGWNARGSAQGLEPIRALLLELADELWQHLESFPDDDPPREAESG